VFIELTDHLRCPRSHPEAFLVLLPDQVNHRRVIAGHLGCPICGWSTAWTDGVPDFGDSWRGAGFPPFDAGAVRALLGIDGPGGWVALAGNAGALAGPVQALLGEVSVVAVNPPPAVEDDAVSIVLSGAWPLKAHAMRGVVLGADAAGWREEALLTTLPGLRCVGVGEPPTGPTVDLLADAGGVWVATHR
jgi:hypothetical protein